MLTTLLMSTALAAKPSVTLPVEVSEMGGLLRVQWDCSQATIDTSDKKGRGHAACLRSYQMDPTTGASFVEVLVTEDVPNPTELDRRNLWLEQRYDDGTRWRIKYFGIEATDKELVKRPAERGETRTSFRAVFAFSSFDLPSSVDEIAFKLMGGGGDTTWALSPGLRWTQPIAARALAPAEDAAQVCAWDEVNKGRANRVAKYLSEMRSAEDFVVRFDWSLDGDGKVRLNLPQPWFSVEIDQNRLAVRGAEVFIRKLPELSRNPRRPNPVEIRFDGQDATVRIGESSYGPFFARRRPANGRALTIELETGGKDLLTNFQASMCTPVPEEIEAAPPPPPPPAPVAAAEPATEERVRRRGVDPLTALAALQGQVVVTDGSVSVSVGVGAPAAQPVAPVAVAPVVSAVNYASMEIRGLTPMHQASLDNQPVAWDAGAGVFRLPRVYAGQRLRVLDRTTGLDWSADLVPDQLGMHEVCLFTQSISTYVISCSVAGPIAVGGVAAPLVPAGPVAMDVASFTDLRRRVEGASFTSDKMGILESAAKRNHFTVAQITQLIGSIMMDNDQVDAAVLLYPRCVDLENWYRIYDAFDFESSKRELQRRTE
jgi:aspartate 1-decarboxylase